MVSLVWKFGLVGLVRFCRFGLVGLVWFGRFGSVWWLWFGFVNKADIKRPVVPLKVAKASIELHLETIPARSGSVRSGSVRVGPGLSNSDIKANSVQLCWGWD